MYLSFRIIFPLVVFSGMAVVFSHFYSDDVCADQPGDQSDFAGDRLLLFFGRDFGVKTAYVTVVSSLLLNVFEKVFLWTGR